MATYTGLDRPKSKFYYQFWGFAFVLGLCGVMALLYYSTKQVEYTWRWNRVPQYFIYDDKVNIRAEMEGTIISIEKAGEDVLVTVRGTDGEESHTLPQSSLLLS
ncbi:MAG: amino acid ABC transporter permease, partial [Desulfomicrobium sp.]|nr:amino acid ABC transporter permease [Desulfomicrobium sp.]